MEVSRTFTTTRAVLEENLQGTLDGSLNLKRIENAEAGKCKKIIWRHSLTVTNETVKWERRSDGSRRLPQVAQLHDDDRQ